MTPPSARRRSTLAWVLLVAALLVGVASMHTLAGVVDAPSAASTGSPHDAGHGPAAAGEPAGHHGGTASAGLMGVCVAVLTAAAVVLLVLLGPRAGRGRWVPRGLLAGVPRPPLARLPRPPDLAVLSVLRC
ncbi:DUF6153 family protein [Solicola sp. PLA-1-18]|uniref:DUF6153 family protein n=1 Tax=Solicola sp. PLA-1-18 TaxID=3380532 RepID=UPI003B80C171